MAVKESDIRAMMKTVMSSTMQSVSAGRKTVISPTEVRNITKEIVADAESGSIKRFENALDKTEKIIDKLDVNLKDFNTALAKRVKELGEQRDKSAKEVEALRAQNIVAETRTQKQGKEFRIETNILTKKEIENRKSLLDQRKKLFKEEETKILKKRDILLSKEIPLNKKEKEIIIRDEERLQKEKDAIRAEEQTLTPLSEKDDMKGPSSTFYEELKAPFVAVGDAFMSLKDIGNDMVRVFQFFTKGGLTKSLGKFKDGIKALGRFFMSTKVLIGLAIAGVIAAVVFFKDKLISIGKFIIGIPEMIVDGIKTVWTMITDFFKSAINTVIKLINKIPGINIPLLETSKMKEEKEEKAKQERIKKGDKDAVGDTGISEESGFITRDDGLMVPQYEETGFDDAAMTGNRSNIMYNPRSKQAFIMNRQVVGDQLKGSGARGTGDASTAKTLYQEQKQAKMFDTGEVPPVILNNSNTSSVQTSGSTTVGFVNNKNIDETFTNLNYAVP